MVDLELLLTQTAPDEINVVEIENAVLERLNMPASRDLTMRSYHAYHTFIEVYAAGVYTYFWSDALAADIEQAFLGTPEGLRNEELLDLYKTYILEAAYTIPATEAFNAFRGRDPRPEALFERYGIHWQRAE